MNPIKKVIQRLSPGSFSISSRTAAKNRLKLVIAHDRSGLTPEMMESMRRDIIEVLARYVEIDTDEMDFAIENDQRITSLMANLPIRRVKLVSEWAKQEN